MTTIDTNARAAFSSVVAQRLMRLVFVAADAITERRNRRVTFRKLSHLTDRELDDIGLTRADVYALR